MGAAAGMLVVSLFMVVGLDEPDRRVRRLLARVRRLRRQCDRSRHRGAVGALLLALVRPRLRNRTDASVAGLAAAGIIASVAGTLAAGHLLPGLVFGLVCATMGGMVGGWVVFGQRCEVEQQVEVTSR